MRYIARAHWEGSRKKGRGTLNTQSGAIREAPDPGTNPQELLAATHAGCFTMAVCAHLTKKGYDPAVLETEAIVTLENEVIIGIHLVIEGTVKNLDENEFVEIARTEERNCIISQALRVPVSTEARLVA